MPSPPGRFSLTIGWSHFLVSRSASNRAPIPVPLPGPSVRMNLTDRVGHDCAATGAAANSGVNNAASINVQVRRRAPTIGPPIGYCEETRTYLKIDDCCRSDNNVE